MLVLISLDVKNKVDSWDDLDDTRQELSRHLIPATLRLGLLGRFA